MKNTLHSQKRYRKPAMKWFAVLSSAALLLPAAWSPAYAQDTVPSRSAAAVASASESETVLKTFQSLLKKKNGIPEATAYLDKNISKTSPHHATLMVLYLENARKKALPTIDEKFYPGPIQLEFRTIFKENNSMNQLIQKAKTQKVKNLLTEARNYGYKVITSEGMYYLTMDYSTFEKYKDEVKEDIAAYIDTQSELSSKQMAKDAALTIGYQELVNRAKLLESFVSSYPNSNRTQQIEGQFDLYKHVIFYGMDNTPLFDYVDGTIRPNAKKAYTFIAGLPNENNSELHNLLKEFVDVLKANDYKQTAEVTAWLDQHAPIK